MAPKKKKTQLKPVARGFATTSVPKKVVEAPKEPEAPHASGPSTEKHTGSNTQEKSGKVEDAMSETDQVLQGFIDRFQDKVEKEIVRTVKVKSLLPHVCFNDLIC